MPGGEGFKKNDPAEVAGLADCEGPYKRKERERGSEQRM